MRTIIACSLFVPALLSAVGSLASDDLRTWTIGSGRYQVDASLVGEISDSDEVILRRADGRLFSLRREQLSVADRRYLDQRAEAAQARGEADPRGAVVEPADSDPPSGRYAFLIGVNDYGTYNRNDHGDRLESLSFCVADMEALKEKLEQIGFSRVYCLTTESTLSWQPTKVRIEQRFQELLDNAKLGPNDLVLVALAGHGLEMSVDGNRTASYFCPADAHSERSATMIPINWFYDRLAASHAGMKLLVVDACRNLVGPRAVAETPEPGPAERGFMRSLAGFNPPQGIAAFLSCSSGEFSHEVPKLGHGVFMHFLLEGLQKADSAAGNRDGWISLSELFNFTADQTEHYVNTQCPVKYSAQRPVLRGDLPNYKLVAVGPAPVGPTKLPPAPNPEALVALREDFQNVPLAQLPKGWQGDDAVSVQRIDGSQVLACSRKGTAKVTTPSLRMDGDFRVEVLFSMYFKEDNLLLTLNGRGADPSLRLSFLRDGPGLLSSSQARVELAGAKSTEPFSPWSKGGHMPQLTLLRKGDTFTVSINGQVVLAQRLSDYADAAFESISIELIGNTWHDRHVNLSDYNSGATSKMFVKSFEFSAAAAR